MVHTTCPGGRFKTPGSLNVATRACASAPARKTTAPSITTSWATVINIGRPSAASSDEAEYVNSRSTCVPVGTFTSTNSGAFGATGGGAEAEGAVTIATITLSGTPACFSFWRAAGEVSNSHGED